MREFASQLTDDQKQPEVESPIEDVASLSSEASIAFRQSSNGLEPDLGAQTRQSIGWGAKYLPPLKDTQGRSEFRRICADLTREVQLLGEVVHDGRVTEEGSGVVAEILNYLESMYDCAYGEGESLKGVVVAIQSQVNNVHWTQRHVDFIKDTIEYLSAQTLIDDGTVGEINDIIERHDLDLFRGTVTESDVVRRFRIVEVPLDE